MIVDMSCGPYICGVRKCKKEFLTQSALARHYSAKHKEECVWDAMDFEENNI